MNNGMICTLDVSEIAAVNGGSECTRDIATGAAGVAAVIAIVAVPFTFGASLAIAAAAGFAVGVSAGSANTTCRR